MPAKRAARDAMLAKRVARTVPAKRVTAALAKKTAKVLAKRDRRVAVRCWIASSLATDAAIAAKVARVARAMPVKKATLPKRMALTRRAAMQQLRCHQHQSSILRLS